MKLKAHHLLITILTLTSFSFLSAQSKGTITGQIIDKENGEGLPGVNVMVKGTYFGAASGLPIVGADPGRAYGRPQYHGIARDGPDGRIESRRARVGADDRAIRRLLGPDLVSDRSL